MLKLFTKIILIILIAFIPCIGIDHLYRNAYGLSYQYPKNILPLPEIKEKYNLVKVGNSHAEAGIIFDNYKTVKTLDLSHVAQSFEFDFALLKMNSAQIDKNAIIIINVSPLSFSQDKPKKDEEAPNMIYYTGGLSPLFIPRLKLSDYLQIQLFPFTRAGHLWREEYAKDQKENAMSTFAKGWETPTPTPTTMPETTTPTEQPTTQNLPTPTPTLTLEEQHGLKLLKLHESTDYLSSSTDIQEELAAPPDPTDDQMESSVQFMSNKWNNKGFSTYSFKTNHEDLQKMIDYCLAQGWRPVLVTLPINQTLIDRMGGKEYLNEYIYDNLKQIKNHSDVPYFSFIEDKRLTENRTLYTNSDHLNHKGASIASYLLLQKLIEVKYLSPEANGYLNTTN